MRKLIRQKMIIGLCGREGAGKTTVANFFSSAQSTKNIKQVSVEYFSDLLGFPQQDFIDFIRDILNANFNVDTVFDIFTDAEPVKGNIREVIFSQPLKELVAGVYGIPLNLLMGATPNERLARETVEIDIPAPVSRRMTGRQLLEFIGTDIFHKFPVSPLLLAGKKNIDKILADGGYPLLSDLRFKFEFDLVRSYKKNLIFHIYRKESDLVLTDADRQTHPAKWKFLECVDNQTVLVHNNGTINDLKTQITNLLSERQQ